MDEIFKNLHKYKRSFGMSHTFKNAEDINSRRRESRKNILLQKRKIDSNMSPISTPEPVKLMPANERSIPVPNKRLEMLVKWREEKERKKLLEKKKTKPVFKVAHISKEIGLPNLETVNMTIKGKLFTTKPKFSSKTFEFVAPASVTPATVKSNNNKHKKTRNIGKLKGFQNIVTASTSSIMNKENNTNKTEVAKKIVKKTDFETSGKIVLNLRSKKEKPSKNPSPKKILSLKSKKSPIKFQRTPVKFKTKESDSRIQTPLQISHIHASADLTKSHSPVKGKISEKRASARLLKSKLKNSTSNTSDLNSVSKSRMPKTQKKVSIIDLTTPEEGNVKPRLRKTPYKPKTQASIRDSLIDINYDSIDEMFKSSQSHELNSTFDIEFSDVLSKNKPKDTQCIENELEILNLEENSIILEKSPSCVLRNLVNLEENFDTEYEAIGDNTGEVEYNIAKNNFMIESNGKSKHSVSGKFKIRRSTREMKNKNENIENEKKHLTELQKITEKTRRSSREKKKSLKLVTKLGRSTEKNSMKTKSEVPSTNSEEIFKTPRRHTKKNETSYNENVPPVSESEIPQIKSRATVNTPRRSTRRINSVKFPNKDEDKTNKQKTSLSSVATSPESSMSSNYSEEVLSKSDPLKSATKRTPTNKKHRKSSPIYISPFVTISRGKDSARKEYHTRTSAGGVLSDSSVIGRVDPIHTSPKSGASYFTRVLDNEISRIEKMCNEWIKYKEEEEPCESACDMINTAVGQSNLLITKKFEQFRQLIAQCIDEDQSEQPVTCEDLHGFWEMVYIQVEDLNKRFANLETLKNNNWEEVIEVKEKVKRRGRSRKKTAESTSSLKDVIKAARMKKKQAVEDLQVDPLNQDDKTFDGGFFVVRSLSPQPQVKSPAKSMRNSLLVSAMSNNAKRKTSDPRQVGIAMLRASRSARKADNATPSKGILKKDDGSKSTGKLNKSVLFSDSLQVDGKSHTLEFTPHDDLTPSRRRSQRMRLTRSKLF